MVSIFCSPQEMLGDFLHLVPLIPIMQKPSIMNGEAFKNAKLGDRCMYEKRTVIGKVIMSYRKSMTNMRIHIKEVITFSQCGHKLKLQSGSFSVSALNKKSYNYQLTVDRRSVHLYLALALGWDRK